MSVRIRARSAAKTAIRRGLRSLGYEIVPFGADFAELQRRLLPGRDLLVDVGANTGQYAELTRALGHRGRILSFEPQADAYDTLARHASGDPLWEARRYALAAGEGTATLRVSRNSVSSSLLAVRDEHVRAAPASVTVATEEVPTATLDGQLDGDPARSIWLKLDVQGAEGEVLAGATTTLTRTAVVQTELSLSPLYDGQADWLALCDRLRDHGLRLAHLEPGFQDPVSGRLLQLDGLFVRD